MNLDLTNKIGLLIHIPKTAGRSIGKIFSKDAHGFAGGSYLRPLHCTALYVKDNFFKDKENEWNRLYKITWVRNPWERAVSLWKFSRFDKVLSNAIEDYAFGDNFKFWLFNCNRQFIPLMIEDYPYNRNPLKSLTYISDLDGNLLVDFIGRFEYINEDIDRLNKELNKNFKLDINKETNNFGKNYQKYYDDESREYIAEVCKWEIEKFNYKFEKKA